MDRIRDLDLNLDLEKPLSKLSVLSESHETHTNLFKWQIPKSNVGACISSNWIYIGSLSYYLMLYPNGKDESLNGFVSVIIKFNEKCPENAWIEGKISVEGRNVSETFCVSSHTLQKEIDKFFKTESLRSYVVENDLIICYSMKMKLREVKCKHDDKTVQCNQSRNLDPSEVFIFEHEHFSDITIHLEDGELKAHKILLSKIPYFQSRLNSDDSFNFPLMEQTKCSVFKHVLNYLHVGDTPVLDFRLACELYTVANGLDYSDLKNICTSYLAANLTARNVFIVIKLAHDCNDDLLKKECIEFIKNSNLETLVRESIII